MAFAFYACYCFWYVAVRRVRARAGRNSTFPRLTEVRISAVRYTTVAYRRCRLNVPETEVTYNATRGAGLALSSRGRDQDGSTQNLSPS